MSQPIQTEDSTPAQASVIPTPPIVRKVMGYFRDKNKEVTYLDDAALAELGFKRTHIDYITGNPDNGPKVLKPKLPNKITLRRWVWNKYLKEIYEIGRHTDFHIARMVGETVKNLLVSIADKNHYPDTTILDNSPWKMGMYPQKDFTESKENFGTTFVLFSDLFSDIILFNAVEKRFQKELVSLSEILTLSSWYGSRLQEVNDPSKHLSVTLISVSGKEVRISQIYDIHLGKGLKDLRQSDIFTLYGKDQKEIRRSAIYLARWAQAELCWP